MTSHNKTSYRRRLSWKLVKRAKGLYASRRLTVESRWMAIKCDEGKIIFKLKIRKDTGEIIQIIPLTFLVSRGPDGSIPPIFQQ